MGRDKARDDKLFNCAEQHESKYVSYLYSGSEKEVEEFLKEKCKDKTIYHSTHLQVYELIEKELKLPIPIE